MVVLLFMLLEIGYGSLQHGHSVKSAETIIAARAEQASDSARSVVVIHSQLCKPFAVNTQGFKFAANGTHTALLFQEPLVVGVSQPIHFQGEFSSYTSGAQLAIVDMTIIRAPVDAERSDVFGLTTLVAPFSAVNFGRSQFVAFYSSFTALGQTFFTEWVQPVLCHTTLGEVTRRFHCLASLTPFVRGCFGWSVCFVPSPGQSHHLSAAGFATSEKVGTEIGGGFDCSTTATFPGVHDLSLYKYNYTRHFHSIRKSLYVVLNA